MIAAINITIQREEKSSQIIATKSMDQMHKETDKNLQIFSNHNEEKTVRTIPHPKAANG